MVNAGGVINVFHEMNGPYDAKTALEMAAHIYAITNQVIPTADERSVTTTQATGLMVEERLAAVRRKHRF
jgi:glutamate dehydrogenase/leucine dehydrogenase